jgi:hypothetical protein
MSTDRTIVRCQLFALLIWRAVMPLVAADAGGVTLFSADVPHMIVADPELHEPLAAALSDLDRCLSLMAGRELQQVRLPGDGLERTAVVITQRPVKAFDIDASGLSRLGAESFILRTRPVGVVIAARTPTGAQHGIYELLHRLGCRWFFPGQAWEQIPRRTTAVLPVVDVTVSPSFAHRQIWYGWGAVRQARQDYRDWTRRNRQGGTFTGSVGHAYANIATPAADFEAHPEWFPFWDGERHPSGQLCLSNPDVQQRGIAYARERFRAKASYRMVSLSPNDGRGYCQCDACAALGSTSDQTVHFANVVAAAVHDEFPDRYLSMYAYSDNCAPPTLTAHPNVIVYVATKFIKSEHTVDELIDGWSKKVSAIGIRDYYDVIIWSRDMTRWSVDHLRARIPFYHSRRVRAITAEASCNWAPQGINYYVASRLMWDHTVDVDAVLAEFYASWGPAAVPMQRYFERWRGARRSPRPLGLLVLMQDLEEAAALAASDPVVEHRVDLFRLYLHWVALYQRHRRAKGGEELWRTAREAMHMTWRLGPTSMVHTVGQFRERRMWRLPKSFPQREIDRWKLTDAAPETATAPDAEAGLNQLLGQEDISLDEPPDDTPKPKPFFTHAEIDGLLAADIAAIEAAQAQEATAAPQTPRPE